MMIGPSRLTLLAALAAASLGIPSAVRAAPSACPTGTVCDHALGVAISLQPGWLRLGPPQVPPHVIALVTRPSNGLCCADYDDRLHIAAWGTTSDRNDARAANAGADRLISEFRARLKVTRTPVRYGGAPGVLLRGLPPTPGPAVDIVLAHAGAVYLIIAPGSLLTSDQRAALASLRFIPRQGPFPSANPAAPKGPPTHRTIKGGVFSGATLTLTRGNGIHRGGHTDSLWFAAQRGWTLTYSVGCSSTGSRMTVKIVNIKGTVLDRVLHRTGAADNVRQVEDIAGSLRLEVQTPCQSWRVTASPVYG